MSATRKYAVYAEGEKIGYVAATDRKAARKEAAATFGGSPERYFVAAAAR